MMTPRTATGPIRAWMRLRGWRGYASIWGVVYVMSESDRDDARLMRHEAEHLRQIERDGALGFAVRNLWWTLRYGYRNNPYEIEARAAESNDQS